MIKNIIGCIILTIISASLLFVTYDRVVHVHDYKPNIIEQVKSSQGEQTITTYNEDELNETLRAITQNGRELVYVEYYDNQKVKGKNLRVDVRYK